MTTFHATDIPKYPYDIERAKQLLDQTGLKAGADGKRFKIMHDFVPLGTDHQCPQRAAKCGGGARVERTAERGRHVLCREGDLGSKWQ